MRPSGVLLGPIPFQVDWHHGRTPASTSSDDALAQSAWPDGVDVVVGEAEWWPICTRTWVTRSPSVTSLSPIPAAAARDRDARCWAGGRPSLPGGGSATPVKRPDSSSSLSRPTESAAPRRRRNRRPDDDVAAQIANWAGLRKPARPAPDVGEGSATSRRPLSSRPVTATLSPDHTPPWDEPR